MGNLFENVTRAKYCCAILNRVLQEKKDELPGIFKPRFDQKTRVCFALFPSFGRLILKLLLELQEQKVDTRKQ